MPFNDLHELLARDKAATRCADVQRIIANDKWAAGRNYRQDKYKGIYALHLGMENNAPADVIKLIFDAYPEAAGKPAAVRVLGSIVAVYPLHYGMKNKAPADAIKLVVDACPEVAGKPDEYGKYPLYYGMMYNAPADAIKVVVDACPAATSKPDLLRM